MKQSKYLLDTNVVIDMLKKKKYRAEAIPVITVIEVLRGVKEEKRTRIKQLLEDSFDVLSLENRVILNYCQLYRELKSEGESLSDADLLVASTAIAHGLTLKSKDSHFERLEKHGLILERLEYGTPD